ncbi:MAG TPA: BamA/TamA family outer membrane protein [Kofleriaceae bacterium]|nr:BamA/TamA family outer membrane protein [Kofleriaceae bacterium]
MPTRETGVLPLIGGDTDIGVGVGAIGSVAMFDRTHRPYRWQIQFSAFIAAKDDLMSPTFEDVYALAIFPQLLDGHLRLELRPSFTRDTTLPYYGVGNRAPAPAQPVPQRDFYQRIHPAMAVLSRWSLLPDWSVLLGAQYIYNQTTFESASTAAMDVATIDPGAARAHSLLKLETGVVYDTRDTEISTSDGQYHQVTLRVSPRMGDPLPYQYEQVDAMARFYVTLIPKRMVLAVRGVFDMQIGDVPFYELARYEDTSAIGGGNAIRGVPAYRYYGKVKAFGNVELRTAVTGFSMFGRSFKLGVASFFDAGRMWSGMDNPRSGMDGTGLGLHYGVGGGLRLRQGQAFVVRADVAWSPDARPVGAYVMADEMF